MDKDSFKVPHGVVNSNHARNDQPKDNSNNIAMPSQSPSSSTQASPKRIINKIPLDFTKLKQAGLDRKLAEALSKQQHLSAVKKIASATTTLSPSPSSASATAAASATTPTATATASSIQKQKQRDRPPAVLPTRKKQTSNLVAVDEQSLQIKAMIKNKILNKMTKNHEANATTTTTTTTTPATPEVNTNAARSFTSPIAKADVTARPKLLLNLVNQLPKHRAMCGGSRQARQQPTPTTSQPMTSLSPSSSTPQPKQQQPVSPPVPTSKPLIVLENKVLAPNEKIDLNDLRLSKGAPIALPPKVVNAPEPESVKSAPRILQLPGSGAKKVILNAHKLKMSREQISQLAKQISKQAEQHPVAKPKADAPPIPPSILQDIPAATEQQKSLISPVVKETEDKRRTRPSLNAQSSSSDAAPISSIIQDIPAPLELQISPVGEETPTKRKDKPSLDPPPMPSPSLSAVDFIAQLKASNTINYMDLSAEEMSMNALFMGCETPTSSATPESSFVKALKSPFIPTPASTPEPSSTHTFPSTSASILETIPAPSSPVLSSSSATISEACNAEDELPIGKILQMDDMDILHATMNVNDNEPNVLCISPNAIKLQTSLLIAEPLMETDTTVLESQSSLSTTSTEVVTTPQEEPKKVEEIPTTPVENKEEKPTNTRLPFRSKKGKINLVQRNKKASVAKNTNIKQTVKKVEEETAAANGTEMEDNVNFPEKMEEEEQIVGKHNNNIFEEENEEIAHKKRKTNIQNANESEVIVKNNIEKANESEIIVNNVVKVNEKKITEVVEDQRVENTKINTETTSETRGNEEVVEPIEKLAQNEINQVNLNSTMESQEGAEETNSECLQKAGEKEANTTLISPKKELNNSAETTEETPSNVNREKNLSQLYHPTKMPKSKQKLNNTDVNKSEENPTSSLSLMEVLSQEEPQPQGEPQLPFRQEAINSASVEKAPTEAKGIQNLLKHLAAENVVPLNKESKDNKETKSEEPAKAPRKKLLKTRPVLNAKRASKVVPSKTEALHPRKRALLVENKTNGAHRTSSTSDDENIMFHGFDGTSKSVSSLRNTGTDISDDATPDYDETEEDPQPECESVAKRPRTDPAPAEKQLEAIPEQIDKEKAEEIPEQIDKKVSQTSEQLGSENVESISEQIEDDERQKTTEQLNRDTTEIITEHIDKDKDETSIEQNDEIKQKVFDEQNHKDSEEMNNSEATAISEPIDKEEIEVIQEPIEGRKLKAKRNHPVNKKKLKDTQEIAKAEVEAEVLGSIEAITEPIDENKSKKEPKPTKRKCKKSVKDQLKNEAIETITQPLDQSQPISEEQVPKPIDKEVPQAIPELNELQPISEPNIPKLKVVAKQNNKRKQKKTEKKDDETLEIDNQVQQIPEAEKSEGSLDKNDKEEPKASEAPELVSEPEKSKRKVSRKSKEKEKLEDEKPSTSGEKQSELAETLVVEQVVAKNRGRRRSKVPESSQMECVQNKTEVIEAAAPATRKRKRQSQDVRKSTDSTEDATKAEVEDVPLAKRARRGRPARVTPVSTNAEFPTPTGRGRKGKTVAAEATTEGHTESKPDIVSSTPIKAETTKRNRRSNIATPAVSTDTENVESDCTAILSVTSVTSTPECAPKKRGRRPKLFDISALNQTPKTEGIAQNDAEGLTFKFEGPDYWPKSVDINLRLFLIRNREQLETDEDLREDGRGEGPVQCGLCFVRCEKDQWKTHLSEHYGVGWPIDAKPYYVTRSLMLAPMMSHAKSGHRLTCRLCGRTLASGLGMLLHLEGCGAVQQRVQCDICHNFYAASFITTHIRHCQIRQVKTEAEATTDATTADESTTVFSNAGRAKRKSTIKAETKLQKMVAQLGDEQKRQKGADFENDSSDYDMNVDKESSEEYESEGVDSNEEDDQANSKGEDYVKGKKSRDGGSAANSSRISDDNILKSKGDLAVRWKYFIAKNYSNNPLYASLLPYYEQLSHAEAMKLLPSRESSSMRYAYGHKVHDWLRLAPLEAFNKEDEFVCHLGKPIKKLAWVPLPPSVETQYLLCSQRPKMLSFTRQFKDKQQDDLLLLMECKVAASDKRKEWPLQIRLHYGIRVQETVNSFEFMPSGGYDESTNRLGLLAVGSSAGVVIYALPLLLTKSKTVRQDESPVIVLEPGITLSLDINNPVRDPCSIISWSQASGHKLLVTGYASGNIAFWNMDDVDGLNCIEQNNQRHLLPAHYFYFGERTIQNLELHYDTKGARWLAVGTAVRKYCVYDIANWSHPLAILGDMIINLFLGSMTWSPLWTSLIIGCSQLTRVQFPRLISINPLEMIISRQKTLDVMMNTIRDMHFNYDQDMVASISDNGDLVFIQANEFSSDAALRKRKKKNPFIACEANFLGDDAEPKHVSPEIFQRDYGLLLRPIRCGVERDKASSYQDPKREPSFSMRNMIRSNSVRWNWNSSATNWVAVGAEHGLLRIVRYKTDN